MLQYLRKTIKNSSTRLSFCSVLRKPLIPTRFKIPETSNTNSQLYPSLLSLVALPLSWNVLILFKLFSKALIHFTVFSCLGNRLANFASFTGEPTKFLQKSTSVFTKCDALRVTSSSFWQRAETQAISKADCLLFIHFADIFITCSKPFFVFTSKNSSLFIIRV